MTVGNRMLNTSPKLRTYTPIPSNHCYSGVNSISFRERLRAQMLSALILQRVAALHTVFDNRQTRGVEPSFLSYQKILSLRYQTSPVDIKQTVSQRSEPSSRSLLIGEHPHPWLLLHSQDRKSRHRCSKPRRRYELSGATTLLSPE